MSAAAGWYADPSGTPGQLRWWDGAQWTEHLTPDPNVAPQATSEALPAVADVPADTAEREPAFTSDAQVAAGWGSGAATTAPAAPTGQGPPGATTPPASSWGSAGGGPTSPPAWQAAPRRSGNGVRIGLIVAAVVAVLLVAIVGVAFVGLVGFRSTVNDVAFEVGSEDFGDGRFDAGGEVVSAGQVTVGDTIEAAVPGGGSAEIDLVVPSAGTVTLDVRGDGFDPVAQLSDASGSPIASNDDRDSSFGGHSLDPLIEIHLEPGTYRVQVRGFAGESGDFELRTS